MNSDLIALIGAALPLIITGSAFLMNTFIDKRVDQRLRIVNAQISQLQNNITELRVFLGKDPDSFIR